MERHLSSVECMLVRETMVRQEKMYREQVQALHYLYQVQKTLMDEHVSKNCWDVSSSLKPRQDDEEEPVYQFFPPKKREVRNFDLEKLPEEFEEMPDPRTTLDINSIPDTNVELALYPPRYKTRTFIDSGPSLNTQTHQSPESLNYQPYSRPEETGLNSWSYKSNGNYFHLGNPWSQVPGKRDLSNRVAADSQVFPWSAQPPTASAHPWQVSGAGYYNSGSSVLPGTYFSKEACGNVGLGLPGKDMFNIYLQQQQQQQEEERYRKVDQRRNVYNSVLLDYLASRESQLQGPLKSNNACIFGDRNFYRDANNVGVNSFRKAAAQCASEIQTEKVAAATFLGEEEPLREESGVESAASVLVSLTSDTGFCPRVSMNSPGSLKKSVEWFADAIPEEIIEREGEAEVDNFETEMLLLKEIEYDEHAPMCLDTEPAVPPAAQPSTKPVNRSGRPSRVSKRKRDFRSDTLPSITSLSRQEINEDIQMMSGLLRSVKTENKRGGSKVCRMKNSSSPVSTLDVDKNSAGLPWLVSWGVATRRKRKKRQRGPQKLQLLKGTASNSLSMLLTCSFAKKK